ncbi:MAG: Nif3-like dinuclear metal center hexameric protein [Clostridia bacterium]|nr:Nif3-like dinuclear metal center hexameric protein [Clostridia bacterium]
MPTVNDVVEQIEKIAKPAYAYEWDNCGLLVGDRSQVVSKVLITLDITKEVVKEAIDNDCNMIISHHPLIFKGIKVVSNDTYEGEIISLLFKNDIALYCAHTSLDIAVGGVNDALCDALGLKNVDNIEPAIVFDGDVLSCGRRGLLSCVLNKRELIDFVKNKTGASAVNYSLEDKSYSKIALCTGAGEEFAFDNADCDVFITGEIKYHTALELKRRNISFIAVGHYYSEVHFARYFSASLQNVFNVLQYDIKVIISNTNTNPFEN